MKRWSLTLAMFAAMGVACTLHFYSIQYSVPLSWIFFGLWAGLLTLLLMWAPLPTGREILREIGKRSPNNDAEFGALFADGDPTKPDTAIRVRDCLVEVVGDNLLGLLPSDSIATLIRDRELRWDVSDWLSLRLEQTFHCRIKQDELLAPATTVKGLVDLVVAKRRLAAAQHPA
ncbi:MAG TPA: hypothetical protein VGE52_20080, partial [Pirellulales bacterium]